MKKIFFLLVCSFALYNCSMANPLAAGKMEKHAAATTDQPKKGKYNKHKHKHKHFKHTKRHKK